MTREQCEIIVGYLLEDIRNTVKQYDPTIDHISMSISEYASRAWAINDETEEYQLKVDIEKDGANDESGMEG